MQAVIPPLRWTEQLIIPVTTAIMGGLSASAISFTVGKFDDRLGKVEVAVVQLDRSVERLGGEVVHLGEKVDRLDTKVDRLDTKLDRLESKLSFGILGGIALVAYLCKPRD